MKIISATPATASERVPGGKVHPVRQDHNSRERDDIGSAGAGSEKGRKAFLSFDWTHLVNPRGQANSSLWETPRHSAAAWVEE
jgi:hypothetical protein